MVASDKHRRGAETARESGSSPEVEDDDVPVKGKRARRHRITRNACRQCRAKKTKCDGQHPVCSRCHGGGLGCTYDVDQGVTKMQSLKDQLDRKTKDHETKAALLRVLVEGSDQQATELLARLRMAHNSTASPTVPDFKPSPAPSNLSRSLSHPVLHPLWHNEAAMRPTVDTDPNIYASSPENAILRQQQVSDENERVATPSSASSLSLSQHNSGMHMGYPVQAHHEPGRRMSTPSQPYAPFSGSAGPPPVIVPPYSMATTNGWPDPRQQNYFVH